MKFKLEANFDCAPVGTADAGIWESHAADPQFLIKPHGMLLKEGLCEITFMVDPAYPKWMKPKMYFDTGSGFSEESSTLLAIQKGKEDDEIFAWVRLPANLKTIRFDPTCAPGLFSLNPYGRASRLKIAANAVKKTWAYGRERGLSALFTRIVDSGAHPDSREVQTLSITKPNAFQDHVVENTTTIDRRHVSAPAFEKAEDVGVKLVAYYLPQFHPIPENDKWWGKGFTEWTNVGKALPSFVGHYQPRLPGELGYYDLRGEDTMPRQIELAKQHGISAFCFYYYWFDGHRLLERPVEKLLRDSSLDIEYCLCWANENWSRRWDGSENDILMAQNHSEDDDLAIIDDLARFFKDDRYLKVDGKPVLVVYRANILPEVQKTIDRWRARCIDSGIGDIHLVAAETFGLKDPTKIGFDAGVEFPPHGVHAGEITSELTHYHDTSKVTIYDYNDVVEAESPREYPEYRLYRSAMPSWDNTARKGINANVFHNSTPSRFKHWLTSLIKQSKQHLPRGERLIFINAWNEWAEGAYLEPDRRLGYANLMACHQALASQAEMKPPKVSVVVPMYKHEKFVEVAIQSVFDQSFDDYELILVDDCSPDDTYARAKNYVAERDVGKKAKVFQMPKNSDAFNTLNTAIANAKGEIIAILNSDDAWAPDRLAKMITAMEMANSEIAFSKIVVIDGEGHILHRDQEACRELYARQDRLMQSKAPLLVDLLQANVAATTGNLVFTRNIFDKVGGFSPLRLCHDWDFILRASYFSAPLVVDTDGYHYRIHGTNTFSAVNHLAEAETEKVLKAFFKDFSQHPQKKLLEQNSSFKSLVSGEFYSKMMN